jgi:aminoglycoside phosphotransferase (APT) family kinase protein
VLTLRDGREVVLRQPFDTEWEQVGQHYAVLDALRMTRVPAPEPRGVDTVGEQAGRPSLLMSLLPGEPRVQVPPTDEWLSSLALTAARIHETPVAHMSFVPARRERLEAGIARGPEDSLTGADLAVWHLVAEDPSILDTGPNGLVHRDYWSGNTLRVESEVTGVVDWAGACLGPPEVDAAECAFDLVIAHGPEVGERFLNLWSELTGRDASLARRWWLVTLINSVNLDEWLPAYPHLGLAVDAATAWKRRDWLRDKALQAARG